MHSLLLRTVFLASIAVTFGGLTMMSARLYADKPAAFAHAVHMEELEECSPCHVQGEDDKPKLTQQDCGDCHDEGTPSWKKASRSRRLKVSFPHRAHTDSGAVSCLECHAKTADDSQPGNEPLVSLSQCESCHSEKKVPFAGQNCLRCHRRNPKADKPADHLLAWELRHGEEVQWRFPQDHGRACLSCHAKSKCNSCHSSSRPRSHNGLWRMRTHGAAAAWDRDACKTCHETGTCIGCHRRMAPLNHRGAWPRTHGLAAESRDNQRCMVCHSKGWCTACHARKR